MEHVNEPTRKIETILPSTPNYMKNPFKSNEFGASSRFFHIDFSRFWRKTKESWRGFFDFAFCGEKFHIPETYGMLPDFCPECKSFFAFFLRFYRAGEK